MASMTTIISHDFVGQAFGKGIAGWFFWYLTGNWVILEGSGWFHSHAWSLGGGSWKAVLTWRLPCLSTLPQGLPYSLWGKGLQDWKGVQPGLKPELGESRNHQSVPATWHTILRLRPLWHYFLGVHIIPGSFSWGECITGVRKPVFWTHLSLFPATWSWTMSSQPHDPEQATALLRPPCLPLWNKDTFFLCLFLMFTRRTVLVAEVSQEVSQETPCLVLVHLTYCVPLDSSFSISGTQASRSGVYVSFQLRFQGGYWQKHHEQTVCSAAREHCHD